MYVAGLTYSGQQLTDGHIPSLIVAAQLMPGETMENDADWAAELVKVGLWSLNAEDGGWSITNYIEYQPSRERVLADREATRNRQETRRQNRKHVTPSPTTM